MKKYLPLIISLFIFWLAVFFLTLLSTGKTDGQFIYTLDDAYIHMAIAKNFAASGTWGITQHGFTSCSSSPLWTFLVSVFYLISGTKIIIPFLLNILFASLTALFVFGFLKRFTQNIFSLTLILLSVLFFGPFVSVVFTGLEHSMYTMLIILSASCLYKILSDESGKKDLYIFYILMVLLSLSRYEGMFVASSFSLIFLIRKRFTAAILTLLFCFLPILITGLISVSKGWYFFPNSVMLKSPVVLNDFGSFISSVLNPRFFELLWAYKRILILLIISAVFIILFFKDKKTFPLKSLLFLFIITTLLHIQFAKLGSLLRYEMHIIVFGIFVNMISILIYLPGKENKIKYFVYGFLCVLMIPFSFSSYNAIKDVPTTTVNIYQMQYQMSKLINKYYSGSKIALNDIGAVNYYCEINCLDMWGLANKQVAEYRRKNTYNTEKIFEINRESKTEIAIIFESWFEKYGGIPNSWLCAGKWTIPNNITCGADSVTFYATDSSSFIKLSDNLKSFSIELPVQVKQK